MQKILPILLLTITFLFSSQMGVVHSLDPNGDGFLSIRTKPKGREIGKLYNGDKVKILSAKGRWYKIEKISSGTVGYAHSNWIRKTSSASSSRTSSTSSNKEGIVNGLDPNGDGFLALRSNYKVGRRIGKLYEGDKVKILDKRGKWYKVKTVSAGQVGWAHGNWIRIGIHTTVKTEKTIDYNEVYEELCNDKNAKACNAIGFSYDEGKDPYPLDDYKAAKYYRKSCNLGLASGCANLGLMYANGEGVSKNLHQALTFLEKSCNQGSSNGCTNASKIRDNLKNAFRGIRKNDCYKINEYGVQKVCLNGIKSNACYALKDYGLQRVCKEGSGSNACYALKDYAEQRVCKEGIKSNACYAFSNYKRQRSCQNFNGSTEFWLIISRHGYNTY